MKRFRLLLLQELCFFAISIPMHVVAVVQPAIMFLLLSLVLVHPTFEMNLADTGMPQEEALAEAMGQVKSSAGVPYIDVQRVNPAGWHGASQLVVLEKRDNRPTAVQYFGYIDSNLVKNFRNRLTAAGLRLWDAQLGDRAVQFVEYPWLPQERPYVVYFGMAMLPMAAFLAAILTGAVLTAQDFEGNTIMEYRLSPVPAAVLLAARALRLVIMGWFSAGLLLVCVGLRTGFWPQSIWMVALVLLPVALGAGCLGLAAGLVFQRFLPAFVACLVLTLLGWILGSSFGLSSIFGGWYELFSRFISNTYAVELIFPTYFDGMQVANTLSAALPLAGFCLLALGITAWLYQRKVRGQR